MGGRGGGGGELNMHVHCDHDYVAETLSTGLTII